MPKEPGYVFEEFSDQDYGALAAMDEALDAEREAQDEIERIAESIRGLPETRFAVVPPAVVPIFEFDEGQRAFQRMMYYSRFQEVS